MATEGELSFMIASPEKALCDMLMVEHHIPSQSLSALEVFFEEDMRIELDDLKTMDRSIIKQCMEKGKKKQILAKRKRKNKITRGKASDDFRREQGWFCKTKLKQNKWQNTKSNRLFGVVMPTLIF